MTALISACNSRILPSSGVSASTKILKVTDLSFSRAVETESDFKTEVVIKLSPGLGAAAHMSNDDSLPEIFKEFCIKNGIDPEIYDQPQKQYFYTTEASICGDAVKLVGQAVPCDLIRNFYQISIENFQFSTSKLYQEGKLLPMDLSSGLAVNLLELKSSDHILDLCCAPGGKLILSSFLQGKSNFIVPEGVGTLTGVDLAIHRLATCRSMIKKYKVECVRLFCADGTKFNEPVRKFIKVCETKEFKKSEAFHETTAFRKRPNRAFSPEYDKVIVDAQCTHDGSIKHVRKHRKNSWDGFDLTQFQPENLKKLHQLQFELLENGFKLLKPGGILVYSTCSLSRGQNEEIISRFLVKWSDSACPLPYSGSDEFGQLRLCPPDFDSGFFICRLQKRDREKEISE